MRDELLEPEEKPVIKCGVCGDSLGSNSVLYITDGKNYCEACFKDFLQEEFDRYFIDEQANLLEVEYTSELI